MRNKNRKALTDWIAQTDWELAVTLTFRYDITEARARKTLRRWWNEVDRKFYGNAVKRPAKRVKRVCVLETGPRIQLVLVIPSREKTPNRLTLTPSPLASLLQLWNTLAAYLFQIPRGPMRHIHCKLLLIPLCPMLEALVNKWP